jgi:hypothetical protein
MLSQRLGLIAALLVLGAAGCDSGGGASDPAADTRLPDTPPAEDAAEDLAIIPAYPEGPYGVAMGETIENLSFYDPDAAAPVYLDQWYQHPEARLLMIISTAAW